MRRTIVKQVKQPWKLPAQKVVAMKIDNLSECCTVYAVKQDPAGTLIFPDGRKWLIVAVIAREVPIKTLNPIVPVI